MKITTVCSNSIIGPVVDAQQTQNTKQTHRGGFLQVAVGCDCVPAASDVVILLDGGGLVDVDATAGEVCDVDAWA